MSSWAADIKAEKQKRGSRADRRICLETGSGTGADNRYCRGSVSAPMLRLQEVLIVKRNIG